MKISSKSWILITILVVSAYLRFSTLPHLLVITPDESYQAYVTLTLIKSFHIIWIGLSAGAYNLFLGPLWNYIIYPFLYFSHGDPISLGYAAVIPGVLATFFIYLAGKKMFSENTGLIASLLYACSPLLIYYDQKPYPSGLTLLSLLILLSLYMTKYSSKWWILFAASIGMVFHIHLSLLPAIFVAVYWAYLQRKKITMKNFLLASTVFFVLISPLIAFDYFHKGSNILAPITFLTTYKGHFSKSNFIYHTDSLFQSLGRVVYLNSYSNNSDEILWPCTLTSLSTRTKPIFLISGSVLLLLIYFYTRKDTWVNDGKRLLALLSLSILIPFIFFQFINPIEYYLLGFYPLLILIAASVAESLKPKIKTGIYILFIIIAFLGIFTVATAKNDYGLETKKILVKKVMNTINQSPFSLSEEGNCHKYESWRYIFSVYGRKPNQSSEDPMFGWLYKDELTDAPPKYSIIMKETRSSNPVPSNFDYSFQEGSFSTYIYSQ